MAKEKFTEQDLDAVWSEHKAYLLELLNGEYTIEEAREDLRSLIGSDFDPREKFRKLVNFFSSNPDK